MPRFSPDPKEVRATTRVFDRGEYELKVGKPTGLFYVRESDQKEIGGVQVPFTMAGRINGKGKVVPDHEGEAVFPNRFYLHSEAALPFLKRFAMAALGYDRNSEDTFNSDYWDEADLTLDAGEGDDGEQSLSIGAFYSELEGQRVIANLDKGMSQDEEREVQEFGVWAPISS